MLWGPARLQTLPFTSEHHAWRRNMQLVDGSSDVHAVGGAVISVSYSSLPVPLLFSAGSLASQSAVRSFPDSSNPPCPFASVTRLRTERGALLPRTKVEPRFVAG